MSAWYQPGSATLSAGARLVPTAIMTAQTFKNNTSVSSTSIDVSNYLTKSFRISLTSTGTISDYRIQVTVLSCDTDTAANYAQIVYEIYEQDGVYHWSVEDAGKWIRIDIKSWGTADNANYVTATVTIEASAG
jgi:hypothetical protein